MKDNIVRVAPSSNQDTTSAATIPTALVAANMPGRPLLEKHVPSIICSSGSSLRFRIATPRPQWKVNRGQFGKKVGLLEGLHSKELTKYLKVNQLSFASSLRSCGPEMLVVKHRIAMYMSHKQRA
jgi:hypothetical protein